LKSSAMDLPSCDRRLPRVRIDHILSRDGRR
jgi:hypothetical protein